MKISAMMRLHAHRSLGLHGKGTTIPRPSKGILLLLEPSAGCMVRIEPVVARDSDAQDCASLHSDTLTSV